MKINLTAYPHITDDSRAVRKNSVFFAYLGEHVDGRQFVADAIERGAVAILYESQDGWQPPVDLIAKAKWQGVANLREHCGEIAANYYGDPATKLKMLGVTGTNGKSSIANFIAQALTLHKIKCAVLGTLGNGFLPNLVKSTHTTLNPLQLQHALAGFVADGAHAVAMEVSSHALDQGRVNGIEFETAIFTNLSRDHLDYHATLENYFAAKAKLFHWPNLKYAILNADDPHAQKLIQQNLTADVFLYSASGVIDAKLPTVSAQKILSTGNGFVVSVQTPWGSGEFQTPILGKFNISNLLATIAAICLSGVPFFDALYYVSQLSPVPGRMQAFEKNNSAKIVVDYAHTPDALEKALSALREHCDGKLICVFGCGGDRDRGKRPLMANVAEQFADAVIVTNDNPRTEDPQSIANDILQGFSDKKSIQVVLDREKAIKTAVQMANNNDIVLVAGKGHEDYQIIGNKTSPFDDRLVVQQALRDRLI